MGREIIETEPITVKMIDFVYKELIKAGEIEKAEKIKDRLYMYNSCEDIKAIFQEYVNIKPGG